MDQQEHIAARDKINILLKEYDALRTEILTRTNNAYTLLTAAATLVVGAVAWFVTTEAGRSKFLWLIAILAFLAAVFSYLFWVIVLSIERCAYRLVEIEARVNQLAGETRDPLLQWETCWGSLAMGWFRRFPLPERPQAVPAPRQIPREERPQPERNLDGDPVASAQSRST